MNEDIKHRYEHYQLLMSFLSEELPAKHWAVMRLEEETDEETETTIPYPVYLEGDKRENLVRAFLQLPTVQHDRKVADDLVKELQAKAKQK